MNGVKNKMLASQNEKVNYSFIRAVTLAKRLLRNFRLKKKRQAEKIA
jgi:hypothetical protein